MSAIYKRIELVANVAIIAVAIMLGAVLVQKFLHARNTRSPPTPAPAIGNKVTIDGMDWAQNRKTVVLALQRGVVSVLRVRLFTSASFKRRQPRA